jgi:hypothetical protein
MQNSSEIIITANVPKIVALLRSPGSMVIEVLPFGYVDIIKYNFISTLIAWKKRNGNWLPSEVTLKIKHLENGSHYIILEP